MAQDPKFGATDNQATRNQPKTPAPAAEPFAPPISMDQGIVDPKALTKEERAEAFQMGLDTRGYAHLKQTRGLERARQNMTKKPTAQEREASAAEQVKKAQETEKKEAERIAKAEKAAA